MSHLRLLTSITVASLSLGACESIRERSPRPARTGESRQAASRPAASPAGPAATTTPARPASPPGPAKGPSGLSRRTLTVAGASRAVSFYAPTSRSGRPPLVVAFHGTSGSPDDWVNGSDPSGIEALAGEHGFVVAAPEARFIGQSDWDHEYEGGDKYWETAAPRGPDPRANPDLLLVSAILATAEESFGADASRTYALGFSNGGFFALLTAVVMRDRFAAFAEAGAGLVACGTTRGCKAQSSATDCATLLREAACGCHESDKPVSLPTSGRLVPGLLGHNNRDDVVSPAHSCTLHERMKTLGYPVEVMIGAAEGHGFPEGFLPRAWSFFAAHPLR